MTDLEKFCDIQAKLAECKTMATAAQTASERKSITARQRKLQNGLRNVKRKLTESVACILESADDHFDAGQYEAARLLFQNAIDNNPTTKSAVDMYPLYRHAQCCLETAQFVDAENDCELLFRNWPHFAACYYLRGRLGLKSQNSMGAVGKAVEDFEHCLSLLNSKKKSSDSRDEACPIVIDFGDARIWLQQAQTQWSDLSRRNYDEKAVTRSCVSSKSSRSILTTLPAHLLRYIFSLCGHVDLCRLESVCNEWTSFMLEYRRSLWKPFYQRLRSIEGDIVVDTRCPKDLFAKRYRPWQDCANCGERYDPMRNTGGCRQNAYHPGEYRRLCSPGCPGPAAYSCNHAFGWTCCYRTDYLERVTYETRYYDRPKGKFISLPISESVRKQCDAWPRHLGVPQSSWYSGPGRCYANIACSQGCEMGPHRDECGGFLVDSRNFDPLRLGMVDSNYHACEVCSPNSLKRGNKQQREECWQEFLDRYAMVRHYIRTRNCAGFHSDAIWWKLVRKSRR